MLTNKLQYEVLDYLYINFPGNQSQFRARSSNQLRPKRPWPTTRSILFKPTRHAIPKLEQTSKDVALFHANATAIGLVVRCHFSLQLW